MAKKRKYKFFNSKLTSAVSISMVLFLLGCTLSVAMIAPHFSNTILERIAINVFMEDNTSEADIQKMTAYLKAQPYTKTATFKSKEEAIISTCELIGEDPNEFVDYNPLPDMFEVYLQAQYANNDSILFVAQQLTNMEYVKKVDYQKTIIQSIGSKINRVTLLLLGATLLLLVISYVLIRNTIQLLVYSDRFMIHTMKLVGATGHFIRKPYMKQGLYIALVAFVLVVIYIYMLNHIFKEELPFDIFNMQDPSVWVLFAVLLACSIVITSVATFFAVNKYLRQKADDLYYI